MYILVPPSLGLANGWCPSTSGSGPDGACRPCWLASCGTDCLVGDRDGRILPRATAL